MKFLPQARTDEIVVQTLGKELLIYDLKTNRAFNLNETSMLVFNACDGVTSFDDLKRAHNFSEDLIYLTLDELKKHDLLSGYEGDHFAGLSRRAVFKRVGLASMIALPVIAGLTAPIAANAVSNGLRANNQNCTTDAQCASGTCTIDSNFNQKCCVPTADANFPLGPGGFFQSSSQNACAASATRFCCSGMATFNSAGAGTCTCM